MEAWHTFRLTPLQSLEAEEPNEYQGNNSTPLDSYI